MRWRSTRDSATGTRGRGDATRRRRSTGCGSRRDRRTTRTRRRRTIANTVDAPAGRDARAAQGVGESPRPRRDQREEHQSVREEGGDTEQDATNQAQQRPHAGHRDRWRRRRAQRPMRPPLHRTRRRWWRPRSRAAPPRRTVQRRGRLALPATSRTATSTAGMASAPTRDLHGRDDRGRAETDAVECPEQQDVARRMALHVDHGTRRGGRRTRRGTRSATRPDRHRGRYSFLSVTDPTSPFAPSSSARETAHAAPSTVDPAKQDVATSTRGRAAVAQTTAAIPTRDRPEQPPARAPVERRVERREREAQVRAVDDEAVVPRSRPRRAPRTTRRGASHARGVRVVGSTGFRSGRGRRAVRQGVGPPESTEPTARPVHVIRHRGWRRRTPVSRHEEFRCPMSSYRYSTKPPPSPACSRRFPRTGT